MLRYSSRMRSFESASSSRNAVIASLSLRSGLREDERYRFLASCCVIVLAPRSASRGQCARHHPGGGTPPSSPPRAAPTIPSASRRAFLGFASVMSLDTVTLRRRLQQALGKEFTVGDLLGEGGFAAVFRVREQPL